MTNTQLFLDTLQAFTPFFGMMGIIAGVSIGVIAVTEFVERRRMNREAR